MFALRVTVTRGGGRDSVADHDDGHDQRDHEHHAAHPDDDDSEEVKPECLYQVPGHGRACTGEPLFIRPGGLQPCAAEHRGRDELASTRPLCSAAHGFRPPGLSKENRKKKLSIEHVFKN